MLILAASLPTLLGSFLHGYGIIHLLLTFMHDFSISSDSSYSLSVNLFAWQIQGFTSTLIASVSQKLDKSTGKANFTCNIRVTSEVSSGFPPNTSHTSGKLRASRWSTCLVSPAWKCAWSIPIRRSTCLLSRRNFVFCEPTRSDMCEVLTAVISSWW